MNDETLWQAIEASLPAYLERQRWYADKLRPISKMSVSDVATIGVDRCTILLAIAEIDYTTGDSRRYFVPMTVHSEPTPERATIAVVDESHGSAWVQDAVSDAVFRDFLINPISRIEIAGIHGRFAFDPWTLDGDPFLLDPATRSVAATFEQSNSSMLYGEQAIAKLYRRLEAGQNIEVDMNRYLASESGFTAIPKMISSANYHGPAGELPLLLVQQHVGDHRDAWTALTDLLRHQAAGSLEIMQGLGTITGDMHVALASAPELSPLRPVQISSHDIEQWREHLVRSAVETEVMTAELAPALPARSKQAAEEFLAIAHHWIDHSNGFGYLEGLYKTRVHGDYHLGQILVTKDGRLLVVDFEGEPQRPAHERAAMYSPLRDVAGMLRSINYATGVVASSHEVQAVAVSRAWLEHWERDARACFLSEYRRAISRSPIPIAPLDEAAFMKAILALEMDKALYEVRYELNSRPDWAWLPLDSLK